VSRGDQPAPADPESTNALLERTLAETRRAGEVVLASAVVAINGGLHLLGVVQLLYFVRLFGPYRLVPWGIAAFGVAFLVLGSKIYAQRLWAVRAALIVSALGALGMALWFLRAAGSGMYSPLTMILPGASVTAVVCAAMALGPCARTAAARRRAAEAGLDLDLGA
jgi:hypothetical protein